MWKQKKEDSEIGKARLNTWDARKNGQQGFDIAENGSQCGKEAESGKFMGVECHNKKAPFQATIK